MNTSSGFKKYASNAAWMVGGRLVKSLVAFVVGVFVARYLGPERFGVLSYVIGIASMFGIFCSMGLDGIMVRELVGERELGPLLLGSSVIIRVAGTGVAFLCAVLLLVFTHADRETWILALICMSAYFFRFADALRNFYEASVQARVIVVVESIQCLLSSALRIYFIAVQGSIFWFAVCWLSEWVFIAIGFVLHYSKRKGDFRLWRRDNPTVKHLLRESMPLLFSAMAIVVYMEIDRIMLKNMLGIYGNKQVGYYSAAMRIIPFAVLIPQMMSKALAPSVIASKKSNAGSYKQRIQLFNDLMIWMGIGLSLALFLLAKPIMLLFGNEYSASTSILRIVAWKGALVSMSVASGLWIITEGLQKGAVLRNLAGCMVNVVLNYIWIPRWGAAGSAWATLASFATASFFIHAAIPAYRPIFRIQVESFTGGLARLYRNVFCRKGIGLK